ncbi:MAG: hypothetical protein IPJ30_14130 [Acidobacteria bacterium]|nr:hypothetical protein [Acidobacteriota bacterium]
MNDVWQFVIYDAFGKLVAEYGGTVPQDEGGVKYYLQDWQGSVRAGVNAAGFVKSRTDHQAFGEPIASESACERRPRASARWRRTGKATA